tara:strand:+ start:291 stop:506 length:216 start_codon:yes stop_codon:yes gene_type:complete
MLQINPKKFKHIQNKSIPSPLRPKFRSKDEANIYFLSKRRFDNKKKVLIISRLKLIISIVVLGAGGYWLSS